MAQKVVMKYSKDVEGTWHVIAMDNFFTSVGVFKNLIAQTIYATETMRSNHVGIPITLNDTKTFYKIS